MGTPKTRSTTMKPEVTVLNGKVLKQSLPVLPLPLGPDAPALKRLLLPQGELAQFYDAAEGVRYLAFIELVPGQVRGNHYHKVKEELVYVIQGEVLLIVEDIDSKERASVELRTGDFGMIRTGVAHAYRTVSAGQAIEFSVARFDPADIHRYPLA
jgi:mannose-6-phosphate isomerase-like protein (cupin superfamily)